MHIAKFRGFQDISFNAGTNITVITGQNGTQKTTLLGILSQPFSITDKANPLYFERPLCGGNYKSAFAEKFKLSETFDKPKEHEWTLTLCNNEDFTLESIPRGQKDGDIRFWRKGTKDKGPVIYNCPSFI